MLCLANDRGKLPDPSFSNRQGLENDGMTDTRGVPAPMPPLPLSLETTASLLHSVVGVTAANAAGTATPTAGVRQFPAEELRVVLRAGCSRHDDEGSEQQQDLSGRRKHHC
jgi:hypothetical protein